MKRMKLSTAIRKGAKLKPLQHFGDFYNVDRTASCAFGAACDAVSADPTICDICDIFPITSFTNVECPECHYPSFGRFEMIELVPHLNDTHRWTRERIADFVEQVENKYGTVSY
jgi:hypothetical protein